MKPRTRSFVLLFHLNIGLIILPWETRTVFLCCLFTSRTEGRQHELRGSSSNSPFSAPVLNPRSLLWLKQLRWSTYSWALWPEEQGHKTEACLLSAHPVWDGAGKNAVHASHATGFLNFTSEPDPKVWRLSKVPGEFLFISLLENIFATITHSHMMGLRKKNHFCII